MWLSLPPGRGGGGRAARLQDSECHSRARAPLGHAAAGACASIGEAPGAFMEVSEEEEGKLQLL